MAAQRLFNRWTFPRHRRNFRGSCGGPPPGRGPGRRPPGRARAGPPPGRGSGARPPGRAPGGNQDGLGAPRRPGARDRMPRRRDPALHADHRVARPPIVDALVPQSSAPRSTESAATIVPRPTSADDLGEDGRGSGMGTMGEPAAPRRGVRNSLPHGAWLFVLAVAAGAAVEAVLVLPAASSRLSADWNRAWLPVAYAAGLVLAERFVVRVPLRNHRFSIGVAEIVIVLGVVFIETPLLVLATGVGIAASQWLFEPQRVKRLFNVPQYMLSVGAAALVSAQLIQRLSESDPTVAVAPGSPGSGFEPTLTVLWVLGMLAFFLVNHRALLLPLLVVPIGLTLLGNRAWARSLAQGQRMHSLYQAGRALSDRLGDLGAWQAFVRQVAEVLNCEGAAAFLGRPSDGVLEVIAPDGAGDRLAVTPSPVAWEQAAKGYAARSNWDRLHLVPMEAEGRTVGYMAASGPRVDTDFTGDDRESLLTLANQAAAALLNEDLYREAENERATLRDIVGHSTDGIYTVGGDRTVRSWNPAMAALTGYAEEEAIGQKCFNLLRARDVRGVDMCANDCPILAAAQSAHEEILDASVLSKDGRARWINYAHAPVVTGEGEMEADVVVVRDVTRERQTDELKSDFVASVSHELRTPLTPIKGFLLTLMREDRDFAKERRREYYKLMLTQAQRLERLIEDLLEVTRLESGAGLVDATPIDAVDLVRQVADRFMAEDAERVIHPVLPDHSVFCRGDWLRVDQVLGNLLSNALRYSPPHEPVE